MSGFLERLRSQVMLGDGAIGTLLYQRGQPLDACHEALNLDQPETVRQLHRDYLSAGAQLIETNTFGANRRRLEQFHLAERTSEINRRGAELAVELARPAGAFVAGAIGPVTWDPSATLATETRAAWYREQMQALLDGGVDVLLLETFPRLDELLLAVSNARQLQAPAIIASLRFGDDGHTADGVRIGEAFARLREAGANVTGLNCHFGPTIAEKLLQELELQPGQLVSVYPNAGRPQYFDGRYIFHPIPQHFADFAPKLAAQGARLLGGCCGTTPETIAAMAPVVARLRPISSKPAGLSLVREPARTAVAPATAPPPTSDRSLLDLLKEQPVIVTELDPPKSLGLEKLLQGARELRKAGTDYITLADNSLAILRVSNLAAGFLVKERTSLEPIIHLACRDKNLLGLQSELMGLNALGIRHVLALTGDPAAVGDHPDSSNVYDVNSIGLIRTIRQLNEGLAANGRDLKGRTRFTIGCAFNPNARNLDSQVRKLEDKARAGAHFVMTQPIFDPAQARVVHEKTRHLGLPVFVGVMPLLNARNTEFLHNEVPGISIPDGIRERMRGKEGEAGNAEGLAVARDLCRAVLEHFNGIYLITPLLRFDLTVELSHFVRSLGAKSKARPAS